MDKAFSIYERLAALARSDVYPYHMPGHKRNPKAGLPEGFAQLDITEIEHFDNLHHAQGILREAMDEAAALYGADKTYFLVNGSTCGVLAAVSSVVSQGETLILARNAHISAYHGAYLRGCRVVSLYPELLKEYHVYGAAGVEEIERMLKQYPQAKAVFITSPTYDGFVSDVEKIAAAVHAHDKILIVDEAHGAHFGLDALMPRSSIDCGADIVIHSVHKTLPSLTQTALLHIKGGRADRKRIERFLRIYQSSSPSYLLMGSIECCVRQMRMHRGEWFGSFFERREKLIKELSTLRVFRIMPGGQTGTPRSACANSGRGDCPSSYDPSKLMIFCDRAGISGADLQRILLEKYHLQMEMSGEHYVLAILTVMDTREGYARLAKALKELDAAYDEKLGESVRVRESDTKERPAGSTALLREEYGADAGIGGMQQDQFSAAVESVKVQQDHMPLAQAMDTDTAEAVKLEKAEGRIVTEFVYAYPPGISVILPGEKMTKQVIALLNSYREKGLTLQGPEDETLCTIRCVKMI